MSVLAKVLILLQFTILFLPNIAPSLVPKFIIMNEKVDTTNSSNTTNGCHLKIGESALKFISELMKDKITHVIDLHIWTESVNNTINKAQVLTGIKWANEIGRTLISLIAQAEKSDDMMLLSYTSTLKAGIYSMDIVVAKEAIRCFISKDNTSNPAILNLLVQNLYHITGSKTGYKLCLPHNDKNQVAKYNCCTIVGPNDSLICSDYSSIVTKMSPILQLILSIFILYIAFPVTQEYLSQFYESDTYYKISNSPMSLSFILYLVFIAGHGPVKSWGRKLIFALFMVLTTLPECCSELFLWYLVFMSTWLLSLAIMKFNFNEKVWHRQFNPIKIITFPFNIRKVWKIVSSLSITKCWRKTLKFQNALKLRCCAVKTKTRKNKKTKVRYKSLPTTQLEGGSQKDLFSDTLQSESDNELISIIIEENVENTSQPLPQHEEENRENFKKLSFLKKMKKRFLVLAFFIFYLMSIPFLSLYAFSQLILHNWNFVKKQVRSNLDEDFSERRYNANRIGLMLFIILTYGFIVFSIQNLFPPVLNFSYGLFLNGEIYSPIFFL